MKNLICKKCNNNLIMEHISVDNTVICSFCGKKWKLTSDLSKVKTVVLTVQSSQIGVVSNFKEDKNNG